MESGFVWFIVRNVELRTETMRGIVFSVGNLYILQGKKLGFTGEKGKRCVLEPIGLLVLGGFSLA
jgi:hypothetical protein